MAKENDRSDNAAGDHGALQTIAEEMGHVLYRMSPSSIIRESQDLGAGLFFDTDFNTLC